MPTGVLFVSFGEPGEPDVEKVTRYLERIFRANMSLEGGLSAAESEARVRALAERRAPALVEDYRRIGGSPLDRQARAQARAVTDWLRARGHEVEGYHATQFTEPSIREEVARARAQGAERLVVIPLYPLCGPSTTVAAVDAVARAVEELEWPVEWGALTGWHAHPLYMEVCAAKIRAFAVKEGLDLADPGTLLHFSAHGTPVRYLEEGSRYVLYVEDACRRIAERLGLDEYSLGYQNHANRGIEWTAPGNEERIRELGAGSRMGRPAAAGRPAGGGRPAPVERLVVYPVSFVHEQSETLVELDEDLRELVEGLGMAFHRVPVPHDAEGLTETLGRLAHAILQETTDEAPLRPCECRPGPGVFCLSPRPA